AGITDVARWLATPEKPEPYLQSTLYTKVVLARWFVTLPPGDPRTERYAARLAELPDQDRPRPDPVFTLRAFRKPA
ncbi:hypothetical protein ACWDTB_26555, partial [Streptomyces sp. NPDC003487]